MAKCKTCLFYSEEYDEMKRRYNDVIVEGENTEDFHFCEAYTPIPDGVFETDKPCEQYLKFSE